MAKGLMDIKLKEFKKNCENTQEKLKLIENADRSWIRREKINLEKEWFSEVLRLDDEMHANCTEAMRELAAVQKRYSQEMGTFFLKYFNQEDDIGTDNEKEELWALISEYLIDFAEQSSRIALISFLSTIDNYESN